MFPLIRLGDELEVGPLIYKLNTFDIVLFKKEEKLIVHFVWRNQISHNGTVITRSLKNIFEDEEPISADQILGFILNFKIGTLKRIKIFTLNLFLGKL